MTPETIAVIALVMSPLAVGYFHLAIRPLLVRFFAHQLAIGRRVGVTDEDIALAMREIEGKDAA